MARDSSLAFSILFETGTIKKMRNKQDLRIFARYTPEESVPTSGEIRQKCVSPDKAIVEQKLVRARMIANQLARTPFVRLLAVGNSVAMGTATELSDIDFFVVTAANRLWTARFFLLIKAKWLGLTKRPGKLADQADFGFWVDETALDLSPIAIENDVYLKLWLATLIPLVDRGGVYERLMMKNYESRIKNYEFSTQEVENHTSIFETILNSRLGELIEKLLFWIQRWKVWREPITHHSSPLTINGRRVDVVTTRHMLKLHHFDQRAKFRDEK